MDTQACTSIVATLPNNKEAMLMSTEAPSDSVLGWCEDQRKWMIRQIVAIKSGHLYVATNDVDETAAWIEELERRINGLKAALARSEHKGT